MLSITRRGTALARGWAAVLRVFRHYVSRLVVVAMAIDIAVVLGAVALGQALGLWVGESLFWPTATMAAAVVFSLYLADLYGTDLRLGRRELLARLVLALTAASILAAAAGFASPILRFGRLAFLQIVGSIGVGLVVSRLATFRMYEVAAGRKRVLVLGLNESARTIASLQSSGLQPFTIVGFLADRPDAQEFLPRGNELLGKVSDLLNIAEELQPDLILTALGDMRRSFPAGELLECRLLGIAVEDWPTFHEKQTGKILVTNLRPSWLIFSDGFVKTRTTQALKRVVDVLFAVSGLVLSAPLMLAIAVAIRLDSRGPALFQQPRVGQNGRIFVLYKFRSMRPDAERDSGAVWASAGDPRITRVGRILRRLRLDELPQFFNVLLGDMSFIGPRPERPEFVRVLQTRIPFYMTRHSVKPGITGWAQVRHRYASSIDDSLEKLQYDLYYVKNLSPLLDLVILINTIQVVLFARGSR